MCVIKKLIIIILVTFCLPCIAAIKIVSTLNVYGDIAKQIGGEHVEVRSILQNPSQDPHLFSITPSAAIEVHDANIVILNGGDYDPWMNTLLKTASNNIIVIDISKLIKAKKGDNPHFWYHPEAIKLLSKTLTDALTKLDPANQSDYQKNGLVFLDKENQLLEKINLMKKKFNGTTVISAEPIFNYLSDELGFQMRGYAIQISNMNDSPPSVSAIKSFEDNIKSGEIKLFIYNSQVNNPMTLHFIKLAKEKNIPIITVSELLPPNMTYINWIMSQLEEIEKTLEKK